MTRLLALLLLLAPAVRADDAPIDDATRKQVIDYMLKTPTKDADPAIVKAFLKLDPESFAPKQRLKLHAKQIEIEGLLKSHDIKKNGRFVQAPPGCIAEPHPTKDIPAYTFFGAFTELQPDEVDKLEKDTECTVDDLACKFSLTLFKDKDVPGKKKKPMRFFMAENDPLMAKIASYRAKGKGPEQTNFFGMGEYKCHR